MGLSAKEKVCWYKIYSEKTRIARLIITSIPEDIRIGMGVMQAVELLEKCQEDEFLSEKINKLQKEIV